MATTFQTTPQQQAALADVLPPDTPADVMRDIITFHWLYGFPMQRATIRRMVMTAQKKAQAQQTQNT